MRLAKGDGKAIRAYACAGLCTGDRVEWALRTPDWLFLQPVTGTPGLTVESELYVKPDDRWEVNNVRHHHGEQTERLKQTLQGFVQAAHNPGPLQPPKLPDLGLEMAKEEQDHPTESAERSIPP